MKKQMEIYILFVRHVGTGNRFLDTTWAKEEAMLERKRQLEASFKATGNCFDCYWFLACVEDAALAERSEP